MSYSFPCSAHSAGFAFSCSGFSTRGGAAAAERKGGVLVATGGVLVATGGVLVATGAAAAAADVFIPKGELGRGSFARSFGRSEVTQLTNKQTPGNGSRDGKSGRNNTTKGTYAPKQTNPTKLSFVPPSHPSFPFLSFRSASLVLFLLERRRNMVNTKMYFSSSMPINVTVVQRCHIWTSSYNNIISFLLRRTKTRERTSTIIAYQTLQYLHVLKVRQTFPMLRL